MRSAYSMTIFCLLFLCIGGSFAGVAQGVPPLAPPDTSSPRATLKTFLDNMNNGLQTYRAGHRQEAVALAQRAARCLNLEKEPQALRFVMGFYSSLYLKEILDRIEIPADNEIPDAKAVRAENISSWIIPNTEITIALVKDGSSVDRFLFTSETVRNAEYYYEKVKNLPYRPDAGGGADLEQFRTSGSLIVSKALVDSLPKWARAQIYNQAIWQWGGLVLYFLVGVGGIFLIYRWSDRSLAVLDSKLGSNLRHAVGGLILPIMLILFAAIGLWFIVYGLRLLNPEVYLPIAFFFLVVSYLGWIWFVGAAFNRISGVVVSVAGLVPEGMDAQLVRLGFQIVTVVIVGLMTINLGARLGLPTYSLITGLGIGGIAVALAGREALSNIIGTFMIILDRPFKLGDYIVLDGERGEVAQVGIRSTRIRTRDDILISIPNSTIANAKMVNESAPVSMSRIRIKLGVAYDSDLKKVEQVLLGIAEKNKAVLLDPAPRIRFRSFGDSALELELLCWIDEPKLKGRAVHELSWAIKEEFQREGIGIPFPQREVHITTNK